MKGRDRVGGMSADGDLTWEEGGVEELVGGGTAQSGRGCLAQGSWRRGSYKDQDCPQASWNLPLAWGASAVTWPW